MKKTILAALLAASASFSYDWIGTQWIANAKVAEIRQNGENVVFQIAPEGKPNLGYLVVLGDAQARKGSLAILLTAATNGQRLNFYIPGSTSIDPNVKDVQNVTLQVP